MSNLEESAEVIVTLRVARLGPAKRAAFAVRMQAAELVKWRFRHGQVLALLDQLMSSACRKPPRQG